ncbi:WG repeat-containing protein [Owenweeksia hongkongensis]|uniref:WG repeat-containing protein n=1 Tax=Owenweeksia hongkongensis TaxID=253245 RepID=UPI003A94AA6C
MTKHLIIAICLMANFTHAQELTDKEILRKMQAKEIIWVEFYGTEVALVKMKSTKKWGMYEVDRYMYEENLQYKEIVPPRFDSIGWFEDKPFAIVKRKKKYGILLNPQEIYDAATKVKCDYDDIKVVEKDYEYYLKVKVDSKWGLLDWFDGIYVLDPSFDSAEDVPLFKIDDWNLDTYKNAKQTLNADIVVFDKNNGDGVFKARSRETQKWGLFQSLSSEAIDELIPMTYDSLRFTPVNNPYTIVYQNGKLGVYLSKWTFDDEAKQTVECIYEDYKRYDAEGKPALAVKKNGKWGWVDWKTGEEKSEFSFDTPEELPFPLYTQDY